MNEVFGIDPNSQLELNELRALLNTFGMKYGRFIGAYPAADWINILRKNMKVTGIDQARLTSILEKAKDVIIPIKNQYRISKIYPHEWLENTVNLKIQHSVFDYIFTNEENQFKLPLIDDLLFDEKYDPTLSIGDHIPTTVRAYCDAIAPLLLKSTEVHLADQYFMLWNQSGRDPRKWEILRGIFHQAQQSDRCEKICLHLCATSVTPQLEVKLVEYLKNIKEDSGFKELKVAYRIHREMSHGRYIFSIKGGLQFDHGFEVNRHSKKNHVHWLSKRELDPLFETYVERGIPKLAC